MPLLQAQEMTYTRVQELRRDRSIGFLSARALEGHGPPLPPGMDMFAPPRMAGGSAPARRGGPRPPPPRRAPLPRRQPPIRDQDVLTIYCGAIRHRKRRPARADRIAPWPGADGEGASGPPSRRASGRDGG